MNHPIAQNKSRRKFIEEAGVAAVLASQPLQPGRVFAQSRKLAIFIHSGGSSPLSRALVMLPSLGAHEK